MGIRVECYSGHKANERPVRFYIGNRKLEVEELVDRWYGEDHDYFKLLADDCCTYVLKYHRFEDQWELIFYSAPNLPPWVSRDLNDLKPGSKNRPSRWIN